MAYDNIIISSGHGKYIPGASGILDEVTEARRVVDRVAAELQGRGVAAKAYHDDVSKTQNENLNRIVDYHNAQVRDLDVSVHFNANKKTANPVGTEVLYVTQSALAKQLSAAIADVGLIDRGAKERTDLFFLNHTEEPAVLIEVCFVDSEADAGIYQRNFDVICKNIADVLGGDEVQPSPPDEALFHAIGKVSHFGGPDDTGVAPDEGLAFISRIEDAPQLFLPIQPAGTTGLARRLNPYTHYVACRWDYAITPKNMLLKSGDVALVRSMKDPARALTAFPSDWGPSENTGRVADISPSLMLDLGLATDDEVEVIYPYDKD